MASRYEDTTIVTNDLDMYRNVFEKRGVKQIRHYTNNFFDRLTLEQRRQLDIIDHLWKRGDHFYKLAYSYYGDPTYWWVIALANDLPGDSFFITPGTQIFIPKDITGILNSLRSNNSIGE